MTTLPDAFIAELESILGPDGLRDSDAQKAVYASDAYTLEKSLPGIVALPRNTEEVSAILRTCHKYEVPIVPRGAGTGLSGGSTTGSDAVLLCVSRMNRILSVDLPNRRLRAQAGAININLTKAVAGDGYQFAPDPSSQGASTIGGNIANNAGGPHTLKYGVTVNHVIATQVVLADGEIVELSTDDFGYDLVGVVTGSEGTLAVVTEATVKLVKMPEAVRTLLIVCRTIDDATGMISAIIADGILPAALEMIDRTILQAVEAAYKLGLPTDAEAVLLVEVDGAEAGIDRQSERICAICSALGAVRIETAKDAAERARLWMARKKSVGTLGRLAPSHATQDGVVPRTKLPHILREIAAISAKYNLRIANVFHANDGIISTSSLLVGVAAGSTSSSEVIVAGVAGLVAGATAMAAGEYVSVSSQADTEAADLAKERRELAEQPEAELDELANIYVERGLSISLARQVAEALTAKDAFSAHARDELGLSEHIVARPVQAALASAIAFASGAAVPLLIAVFSPHTQMPWTVSAGSMVALAVLGAAGAQTGGAGIIRPTLRIAFWGAIAMGTTAAIGYTVGHAI